MWSHLHQWAGGEPPAEGQNWDPDTEGEAQHGQSQNFMWRKMCRVLCAENINVIKSLVYYTSGVFFFLFYWKVSMWVQLQIPKIEDGNNFGVAVQVSKQSHVESIFRAKFIQLHFKSSFVSTRRKCLSCWPTHAPRSKDSRLRFQSKSLHWRSQCTAQENRPDITPSKVFGRENHKTCCAQYHKNIHNYWEIYTDKQQFRLSEGLIHLYLVKSNRKKVI